MNKIKQLFSILPESTSLPYFVDTTTGEVVMREAANLPFLTWPNKVPCIEANAYMLKLWSQHLSRRTRGGTVATYAKNISPLIRFCFDNQISFIELTDNRFTQFINGLSIKDKSGQIIRTTNTILNIGRRCIDFLNFIGEFHSHENFIGTMNCSIVVQRKEFSISTKARLIKKKYWHHSSFPQPSPVKTRSPISLNIIKKLKQAAIQTVDKHIRLRRKIMIYAYEVTGGRRIEIANIKTEDINEALNSSESSPLLSMITAKKGTPRLIPVPRGFLQECLFYMDFSRKRVIRKTIGIKNDHGYLFINHQTGKPLTPETMTGEMNRLCKSMSIDSSLGHGHLFRHGYITRIMVDLISRHNINNKDEFRRALLNVESLKLELQQYTGHRNTSSLDTYIDLAFHEITNYKETIDSVLLARSAEIMLDRLLQTTDEAKYHQIITRDVIDTMQEIIFQFRDNVLSTN
ncbi:site-specific integrase [Spartinivicinus poritis]|uniref:Site-specific integrase n=1 Tax=Spartinivicinus poritis TaxID=2994640 RepID=A0ABT5U8A1_9GAMM|nr:site-specific integrase [Spartinivicinus sp. A2-2]MDE1462580.1 site-specific integrase [Spartinivicinus sp. A2-2]